MKKGPLKTSEVIIVGAGVVGLTTAYWLAKQGCSVTIIEQERDVRRQASWAGAGILSPLLPWRYPQIVQELAQASQKIYRDLVAEVIDITGCPVECRQLGMLIQDKAEIEPGMAWATVTGQSAEIVSGTQIKQHFTNVSSKQDGLFLGDVLGLRNPDWLIALRMAIEALGGSCLVDRPVTGVQVVNDSVTGVITEDGQVVQGDCVVIAMGAWSQQLISPWLSLPMKPIRGQMLLFEAGVMAPSVIVQKQGCYLIPRSDGRVLCGSTAEDVGYDRATTQDAKIELCRAAEQMSAGLKSECLIQHWTGLRPAISDQLPAIGAVPGVQGLFLNTGHFRHGLTTSPASARWLCEHLLHGLEIPQELNPDRFELQAE